MYVNFTAQRCPKKIIKTFLIEEFFYLPRVSTTLVVYIEQWISPKSFEKFEMALMVYSGPWGKLIHEKYLKSKNLVALSF